MGESHAEQLVKLRKHFEVLSPEDQMQAWDQLWQNGLKPWDRNQPNPALVETVEKKPEMFASPVQERDGSKSRKKALVPGCGGGYDVVLFASLGFDAYGLDTSQTAVKTAEKMAADQNKDQQYPVRDAQAGRGDANFIATDFFKDDWLSQTHPSAPDRTFDIIYDHTFLCALDPSLRPRWAKRMSQLLAPNGRLICVEYPLGKPPKSGGPPHGLERKLYDQLFARPGEDVKYNDSGNVVEDTSGAKSDAALVKVDEWVPTKYFDTMQEKIGVSIWGHSK